MPYFIRSEPTPFWRWEGSVNIISSSGTEERGLASTAVDVARDDLRA